VRLTVADVIDLTMADRTITYIAAGRSCRVEHDRLVFALGSRLVRPPIPGVFASSSDRSDKIYCYVAIISYAGSMVIENQVERCKATVQSLQLRPAAIPKRRFLAYADRIGGETTAVAGSWDQG
jgi:hypothetical protein